MDMENHVNTKSPFLSSCTQLHACWLIEMSTNLGTTCATPNNYIRETTPEYHRPKSIKTPHYETTDHVHSSCTSAYAWYNITHDTDTQLYNAPCTPTQATACSPRLPGYTMHGEWLLLLNHGVPNVRAVGENECTTRRLGYKYYIKVYLWAGCLVCVR